MKELTTYLVIIFMVMYWMFRVVVAVTNTIGIDMGFTISNYTMEVTLLFITIVFMILVIKRKVIGGLLYVLAYALYFGAPAINEIISIFTSENPLGASMYADLFANILGVALPLFVLLDLLLDKNRKAHPVDKKTDWFYKNEKFDRQMDDRADKNNYRTL